MAVDVRVSTIVAAEAFPEARKPAYKLTIDFGPVGWRAFDGEVMAQYSVKCN